MFVRVAENICKGKKRLILWKEKKVILKKLKPGMTVYRVKAATGLSRFNGKWETWSMNIKEINEEEELVLASGYAGERWYPKNEWSKWRMKLPED